MRDVYALVRSLRSRDLPRNRYFDAHQQPIAVEARRLHRFLRAIERDLQSANRVEAIASDGGGLQVSLEFPALRLRRVVRLSVQDRALLSEDPRIAALLQPAAAGGGAL